MENETFKQFAADLDQARSVRDCWAAFGRRLMKIPGYQGIFDEPRIRDAFENAFYAGAASVFGLVTINLATLPDDEREPFIDRIQEELIAYAAWRTHRAH